MSCTGRQETIIALIVHACLDWLQSMELSAAASGMPVGYSDIISRHPQVRQVVFVDVLGVECT